MVFHIAFIKKQNKPELFGVSHAAELQKLLDWEGHPVFHPYHRKRRPNPIVYADTWTQTLQKHHGTIPCPQDYWLVDTLASSGLAHTRAHTHTQPNSTGYHFYSHTRAHTHTPTQPLWGSDGLTPSYPPFLKATSCVAHQMLGSQCTDHSCLWRWKQTAHLRRVQAQLPLRVGYYRKVPWRRDCHAGTSVIRPPTNSELANCFLKGTKYIILFIKMGNFSSSLQTGFISSSILWKDLPLDSLRKQWSYPIADSNQTFQSIWFFFLKICKQIRNREPLLPGRVQTHTGRRRTRTRH